MIDWRCIKPSSLGSRFYLRGLTFGLALTLVSLLCTGRAAAGCHYGNGKQFAKATASQDPRGHVRNFRFLGQLVYEGGDIKYVAWQATPACQGPNCHANKPVPELAVAPIHHSQRVTGASGMTLIQSRPNSETILMWLSASDLSPFTGYPHEHEYPP